VYCSIHVQHVHSAAAVHTRPVVIGEKTEHQAASLPVHIYCSGYEVELCKYKAISKSRGGGNNQLDNTNCSKQSADRIGIAGTGSRQLSFGTY